MTPSLRRPVLAACLALPFAAALLAACASVRAEAPAAAPAAAAAPAPAALALVHARLVDGTGAAPVPDATVIVRGDRIAAAGPAGAVAVPAGARVLDLRGATLLPGLVNAHVHVEYDPAQLQAWAQAGVTTVRDLSARDPVHFRAKVDALAADPRNATIIAATPILTVTDGYGYAYADSPEEMRALVNTYLDRGADVVKTSLESYEQGRTWEVLTPEILHALVEAAHARGKKVSVHVSSPAFLDWALREGVDDLAHMIVTAPLTDEQVSKIAARGIAWVPTLELWRCVSAKHRLSYAATGAQNLARFHRAGGTVAMGTDFQGYACEWERGLPSTELLAMQEAGLSPMEVIVAATRNAARVSDRGDELGTIAPGKRADLLAVQGDPLADLHALAAPVLVVHRGAVIRDEREEKKP